MDREHANSDHPPTTGLTRRSLLQRAAGLGLAASTLGALELLAPAPEEALAAGSKLPEIQFQIEKRLPKPIKVEGVRVRFGPVYTLFVTIALSGCVSSCAIDPTITSSVRRCRSRSLSCAPAASASRA